MFTQLFKKLTLKAHSCIMLALLIEGPTWIVAQETPANRGAYYELTLEYGGEKTQELDKRYDREELVPFLRYSATASFEESLKHNRTVDFWLASDEPQKYLQTYLIGDSSVTGLCNEYPNRIRLLTLIRDSDHEARLVINTLLNRGMFSNDTVRISDWELKVIYLHFLTPESGIADELETLWMGAEPYVVVRKNLPFQIHYLKVDIPTTVAEEDKTGQVHWVRFWADPRAWRMTNADCRKIVDEIKSSHVFWKTLAEEWQYEEKREVTEQVIQMFRENTEIRMSDTGQIEISVRKEKLPKSLRKRINYAIPVGNRIISYLQSHIMNHLRQDGKEASVYCFFYRFAQPDFREKREIVPPPILPPYLPPLELPVDLHDIGT